MRTQSEIKKLIEAAYRRETGQAKVKWLGRFKSQKYPTGAVLKWAQFIVTAPGFKPAKFTAYIENNGRGKFYTEEAGAI